MLNQLSKPKPRQKTLCSSPGSLSADGTFFSSSSFLRNICFSICELRRRRRSDPHCITKAPRARKREKRPLEGLASVGVGGCQGGNARTDKLTFFLSRHFRWSVLRCISKVARWQNLIPSFPWIVPHALHPGTVQGKEGIKFCIIAKRSHSPEARRAKHIRTNNLAIAIWQPCYLLVPVWSISRC